MTIFKQWDSRWAKCKYPYGIKTLASSGCGCCSVANVMVEEPYYSHITPKFVRPYMVAKGYAIYGDGTARSGVAETLRHYGYTVKVPNVSSSMEKMWKYLKKSKKKRGVILFGGGTRGGVTWTLHGHYVAYSKYKIKGGQHWFKMKDSGRWNDGWFCYEKHMKGLVVWACVCMEFEHEIQYPKLKRTKGYSGKLPTRVIKYGSKGKSVKRWQKFLRWAFASKKLKAGGSFRTYTRFLTMAFQKRTGLTVDGVVGEKTLDKAKEFKKKI